MPQHTQSEQIKRLQEDPTIASVGSVGRTAGGFVDLTTGQPITGADLTPIKPLKTEPVTPIPTPDISGITTDAPDPKVQEPASGFNRQLDEAIARLSGRTGETERRVGAATAGYEQQLLDINKQIKNQQVQALKDQERALASGETLGFASGEAQRVSRNNAIETLRLSALAENMQGNILFAEKQAKRAVDLEFAEVERNARIARKNIEDNYDTFTTEQKKRADITLARLDKDDAFVARQKEDRTKSNELIAKIIQNNPSIDSATLGLLQKATNPIAVAQVAASKGLRTEKEDITATAGSLEEFKILKGRAPTSVEELNQFTALRSAAGREPGGAAGINPTDLIAYAQQWASTGKIPTGLPKGTFGLVSQFAKEMPKQEGAVVDVNTGVKPDISDVKIDGLAALYDISKKAADLKALDEERRRGVIAGTFGKVFGSSTQQKYVDLRTEIIDLLARARTGAALTVQEETFYADQLPGRFTESFFLGPDSQKRIENFATKIEGTLDTKLKANGASIVGFSKVKLADKEYKVGDVIEVNGVRGRVLADGSIAIIQ